VLVTRPSLSASFCRRRHVDRRRSPLGEDRSCYGLGDAGYDGFARPRRDPRAMTLDVLAIREALHHHTAVPDAAFDQVFPEELRERSHLHWTPVATAIRAAELLAPAPDARVLDVGAGVGKMCLIGALVTGAMWWGIEQDAVQVAAAHHAAWALDVTRRTRFVQGDGSRLAWDEFDAFYFYNPFSTLMLAPHASPFVRYATVQSTLRRIEQRLAGTPRGTRVVTFHGFGGRWPAGFTRISREPAGDDALELWVRDAG
jgi:predicted RNA methylase